MPDTTNTGPIVVATPTIMDGLVLRWYHDANAYRDHREACSASRNGVSIHTTYLHQVPAGWLEDANLAYKLLAAGDDEQAKRKLVTHRATSILRGDLEPVNAAEPTPDGQR